MSITQLENGDSGLQARNIINDLVDAANTIYTGSYTGSFTGSLQGTSSYAISASWAPGGGGTPGGSDTQVQFNNGGNFDGSNAFVFIAVSSSLQQGESTQAVGEFSHAEGSSTISSGLWSHAEGDSTQAIGNTSHAEGSLTQTIGANSHAEGYLTISSGSSSHAEGISTQAVGDYSHAEGNSTQAVGDNSHAEGYLTISSGSSSHAEGSEAVALGIGSHAEGSATFTGIKGYITSGSIINGAIYLDQSYGDVGGYIGYSITYDDYNFDQNYGIVILTVQTWSFNGTNTLINLVDSSFNSSGAYIGSTVDPQPLGADYIIGGGYSHAEGTGAIAIGDNSHAEGIGNQSLGYGSHTEGYNNKALGAYSHAEGLNNIASGQNSHATGEETIALGRGSYVGGSQTVASGDYQTVVGSWNLQNNTGSKFVVGIGGGSGNTRKDGFTVDADANLSGSIMIPTNTSNPSNPKTGSMYFNPSTNLLYIYNGTAWKSGSFA